MKKLHFNDGVLKTLHFYSIIAVLISTLNISNPNLIESIPIVLVIFFLAISTASSIYLLLTIREVERNKKIDAILFIVIAAIFDYILIKNNLLM